ncbi:hypothetical protein CBR_g39726 [Chara braunii]|uniref:non-specific serine/threonine protein kinase n=1 Tax=Chara braunii TaxID=69332 RepID=A0A388LSC1_CHABU|nr:hypothetical protein CBR_g39726 [Chara braunii]|eukprot:GBG85161.1 hypothetical protein CBR_g39726 [Chara braunii]
MIGLVCHISGAKLPSYRVTSTLIKESNWPRVALLECSRVDKEEKRESHSHSHDGFYAVKKVLIQTDEQMQLVKQEIESSKRFKHPNLLPLLDYTIFNIKGTQDGQWKKEAYLLFPLHKDGTIHDHLQRMQTRKEHYPPKTVLRLFLQICKAVSEMHKSDPPYAHNDVKPGNVLLSRKHGALMAVLMDFGSTRVARWKIRSRSEALALQEWAAEHCSAPYRAPELWDCPSDCDIDERTDVWSLGCTLFALMYYLSPFERSLGESGGSLALAVISGKVLWPSFSGDPPYPETFHSLVSWMLKPTPQLRPYVGDVILHAEKLLANLPGRELDDHEMA